VTRTRDDVVDMRIAAVNQLSALLDAHWPGGGAVFGRLDAKIALEFLARYPAADSAAHLTEDDIAAFCRQMGYSGRRPAAELLRRLRPGHTARRSPPRSVTPCSPWSAWSGRSPARHAPGRIHRRSARRAPGRAGLHVAAEVWPGQCRPDPRRVGRLPAGLR